MESIKVNLIPNGAVSVCHSSQYDVGRSIKLELYEGLTPYVLQSGDEVQLNLRKPDDTVITAEISATATNNYVILTTTEQMTAVYGQVLCELRLTNGGDDIGTANFIMQVEPDVLSNGDPSASVIRDLDAQVAELVAEDIGDNFYTKSETDTLLDAKANASDVYTKSETYTKTETDGLLANKANSSDVYTKSATDELLGAKANSADVYTKTATDALLAEKANTEGEYDDLIAGNAKQLVATVGETDKTPYLFRTSGGALDIGDREIDKLVGGTIAFNQLILNGNFANTDNWVKSNITLTVNNNVGTVTKTTASGYLSKPINVIAGHKYLRHLEIKGVSGVQYNFNGQFSSLTASGNWETLNAIVNIATTATQYLVIGNNETENFVPFDLRNIMYIDLTQMFGATIADYIYSLEQGTAGAGVAWFKRLFNKPYYAYNAGELMSVKTSAHKLVGFNQFDKATATSNKRCNLDGTIADVANFAVSDFIKVVGGASYYLKDVVGSAGWYSAILFDTDKNPLNLSRNVYGSGAVSGAVSIPDNCGYIKINMYTENIDTVCVNLSWDGERNSEYEPYEANVYPLDANLELRGIPKLDADNKLYYDGDTYSSDGSVERRYGLVDLSSLNWNLRATGTNNKGWSAELPNNYIIKVLPNWISVPSFIGRTTGSAMIADVDSLSKGVYSFDGTLDTSTKTIYIVTGTNETPSGTLVYELATPIDESAEPFTNPQIVNDFGTEEYIDSRAVAIPVGHETVYQPNLRAKLEMSPDSPESNGDYLMRHTNEGNSYTPYISPIPTVPTTDGTYTLKATVSSGQATLAWILDE